MATYGRWSLKRTKPYGVFPSWLNFFKFQSMSTLAILCTRRQETVSKYYIYTASKNEEDYFFDAFLSILKNKIQIETSKAKVQVKL